MNDYKESLPNLIISDIRSANRLNEEKAVIYDNYLKEIILKAENSLINRKIVDIELSLVKLLANIKAIPVDNLERLASIEVLLSDYIEMLNLDGNHLTIDMETLSNKYRKELSFVDFYFSGKPIFFREYAIVGIILDIKRNTFIYIQSLCRLNGLTTNLPDDVEENMLQKKVNEEMRHREIEITHHELKILQIEIEQNYQNLIRKHIPISEQYETILRQGFGLITYLENLYDKTVLLSTSHSKKIGLPLTNTVGLFENEELVEMQNLILHYCKTVNLILPIKMFDKLIETMRIEQDSFSHYFNTSVLEVRWFLKSILLFSVVHLQKDFLSYIYLR